LDEARECNDLLLFTAGSGGTSDDGVSRVECLGEHREERSGASSRTAAATSSTTTVTTATTAVATAVATAITVTVAPPPRNIAIPFTTIRRLRLGIRLLLLLVRPFAPSL
jgi:hypothetical protein